MVQVWLFVLISLIVGVVSLYSLLRAMSWIQHSRFKTEDDGKTNEMSESTRFNKALSFIFGLIVVQGLI